MSVADQSLLFQNLRKWNCPKLLNEFIGLTYEVIKFWTDINSAKCFHLHNEYHFLYFILWKILLCSRYIVQGVKFYEDAGVILVALVFTDFPKIRWGVSQKNLVSAVWKVLVYA